MEPYRLQNSLGYNLSFAARLQERHIEEALRTLSLTRITWCILLAVGNENLWRPSDIAQFVGIDRTATSRALRQMENAGLVQREDGAVDRRTTRVTLTPLGQRRIIEGTVMAMANNAAMREKLTETEYDDLLALLMKLTKGEDANLTTF